MLNQWLEMVVNGRGLVAPMMGQVAMPVRRRSMLPGALPQRISSRFQSTRCVVHEDNQVVGTYEPVVNCLNVDLTIPR